MASFKFKDAAFTVDSPDVTYTEEEILAKYTYETVVEEGTKVWEREKRKAGREWEKAREGGRVNDLVGVWMDGRDRTREFGCLAF